MPLVEGIVVVAEKGRWVVEGMSRIEVFNGWRCRIEMPAVVLYAFGTCLRSLKLINGNDDERGLWVSYHLGEN